MSLEDHPSIGWAENPGPEFESLWTSEALQDLRLAISDPGATTPRRTNEYVTAWQARAVLDALAPRVAEIRLAAYREGYAEGIDTMSR